MLKITMSKTGTEDRWTLHGQLTGPWVSEMRTDWRNTQGADEHRRCVFDLNDVTFVDKAGEKLLRALAKQGVQFEASGIYVRSVLRQLDGEGNGGDRSNF
jgi:anti-anti-sigma regulatory factor